MAFVHLHNHTEYSLLDGLTHIKDMVRRAAELDMPAVAVTDHGVMSGMVELSDACDAIEKETGKRVKPIFGCEVYFTPDESLRKDVKPKLYHLLLLAKNNEGYHNLLKLVSESHVDNFYQAGAPPSPCCRSTATASSAHRPASPALFRSCSTSAASRRCGGP